MTDLLRFTVQGLANGSVIALLAVGIVLVYRSTRVLSFAHGGIASMSTYAYFQLAVVWPVAPVVALPLSLVAGASLGATIDLAAMRALRRSPAVTRTVATVGVLVILQVLMRLGWGGSEGFVPPLARARVGAGSFAISAHELLTAAIAFGASVALAWWLRSTYTGLGLTAIAQDRDAARALGVSPARASLLAWGVSGALAGLAGVLATPMLVLNPLQMTLISVTAFGAALAGRFESVPRALVGGVAIGVAQSIATGYVTVSGASEAFGFVVVFLVLLAQRERDGFGAASEARA